MHALVLAGAGHAVVRGLADRRRRVGRINIRGGASGEKMDAAPIPYVRRSVANDALNSARLLCKLLPLMLLVVLLNACGTTDVVQTSETTYSASAQFGSVNGSWDRARDEATRRRRSFVRRRHSKVALLDEQRSGTFGWTPQKSTMAFSCAQNTKEAQQLASRGDFALNPWIGRSIADFVVQRGPPTTSIDLGGNKRAFQWQATRQTPAAVIPLGSSLVGVPSRQESCLVSLVASSSKAAPTVVLTGSSSAGKLWNGAC